MPELKWKSKQDLFSAVHSQVQDRSREWQQGVLPVTSMVSTALGTRKAALARKAFIPMPWSPDDP